MFICNHCPYVQAIAARLAADTLTLLDKGTRVVAVMSNDYRRVPSDAPPNLRCSAVQHGLDFTCLVDQDQVVGRAFEAVCTPEFFGPNKDESCNTAAASMTFRWSVAQVSALRVARGYAPDRLDGQGLDAASGEHRLLDQMVLTADSKEQA